VANLPNTPWLTPGFRAAPLLRPPFEILYSCGILAMKYLLMSILDFACMVSCCCLHWPVLYVAVYAVLYYFAVLGYLNPIYSLSVWFFFSFLQLVEDCFPMMVLFASFTSYCWLVASGFWLLGPVLCGWVLGAGLALRAQSFYNWLLEIMLAFASLVAVICRLFNCLLELLCLLWLVLAACPFASFGWWRVGLIGCCPIWEAYWQCRLLLHLISAVAVMCCMLGWKELCCCFLGLLTDVFFVC